MRTDEMYFPKGPCGSFRTQGVPYFGVLIVRILLFRVLYQGPLFSETPMYFPKGPCTQVLVTLGPMHLYREYFEAKAYTSWVH